MKKTNNKNERKDERAVEGEVVPVEMQIVRAPQNGSGGKQNISIGTLNVFTSPVQGMAEPFLRRYHKHYHPRHSHGKKHFVADVFMLVAIVGLLAFNLFLYIGFGRSFLPALTVAMSVDTETARSGRSFSYRMTYHNGNSGRLEDTKLALRFPSHFVLDRVEPQEGFDIKTNTWSFGNVEQGTEGDIRVFGTLFGSPGETAIFSSTLSYRPERGLRREQKLSALDVAINETSIETSVTLPDRTVNRQLASATVTYVYSGDVPLEELVLTPTFPSGFQVTESIPPLRNGVWAFTDVAPEGTGTIALTGVLTGDGGESATIRLDRAFRVRGALVSQGETPLVFPIFYPQFTLGLSLDPDVKTLTPGVSQTFIVHYANKEREDVLDPIIRVTFPDGFVDARTFSSDTGRLRGNAVEWTKSNARELALIPPGKEGDLTFTIAPREQFDIAKVFAEDGSIARINTAVSYTMESDTDTRIPNGIDTDILVNAPLILQSFGRYFTLEGDQLGRGPLPPIVGRETKYIVFWNVVNQLHAVEDVVITGVLPEYVEWTGKTSAAFGDAVKYDPVSREVSWRLDRVGKATGGVYPDVGVIFEVAVTPPDAFAGKYVPLLQDQSIHGRDTVTEQIIERTISDTTSNLLYDDRAKGKGVVRGAP